MKRKSTTTIEDIQFEPSNKVFLLETNYLNNNTYHTELILNNALCNFTKRPGHIYHLYERNINELYLSILSPQDWGKPPHKYLGSWKLELNLKWTTINSLI